MNQVTLNSTQVTTTTTAVGVLLFGHGTKVSICSAYYKLLGDPP
jgi:hypothetical protein